MKKENYRTKNPSSFLPSFKSLNLPFYKQKQASIHLRAASIELPAVSNSLGAGREPVRLVMPHGFF
ncbi:hypothetical protein L484_021341 [Morus notabilis]|uniref:Uncharacterized protein n=1 Tax=Morus notabilis TaxID=981085 RepID=W9SIN5_9ROSA|nr:hypothetical protein L484_021341 [Morus notabilis]